MLPVTLPWFRNFGIEYITELDSPLTETRPFYTNVQPGDIVYYNPLDSITIIYEETGSVPTADQDGRNHVRPERLREPSGERVHANHRRITPPCLSTKD